MTSTIVMGQTTFSWRNDQNPTSGQWNNSNYWWNGSGAALPGGGEILFLDGNVGTTMTNDLPSTNRYRISFGSTSAASRTIGGSTSNAFYDYGGAIPAIVNSSGVTHTINFPFTVGNTSTATSPQYGMEINASSGNLSIGSTISATNATGTKVLVLRASSSGNGTITLSGVISNGSGTMSITKMETNTAILSAANTYTGTTSITGGTLRLSGSGTLGTGSDVRISSGATLDLNGVNATVGSIAETGSSNGGVVTMGAGNLTINGANKGTLYQNSISGNGGLTMSGSGTTELVLYGTQSYTGTTTVSGGKLSSSVAYSSTNYSITGGSLQLNAANIIPDASTMTLGGGTFSTGSSTGYSETLGVLTLSASSTIALGTGAHTLTFANSSSASWTAGTALTITGWTGSYNGTTGTGGKIFVGSGSSSLTAQQLSQIVFNNGTNNFSAMLLSSGELVPSSNVIVQWGNTGSSTAWYTAANWTPNTATASWTTSNIAQFNNTGSATTAGINMGTALSIGAIEVTNNRTRALTIGNSSGTAGNLTLNGAVLYGMSNTVISNNSGSLFTVQDNETGTGKTMGLVLGNGTNNNVNISGSGGITISSIISGTSKNLTKEGTGSGVLTLSGANTYGGSTTINGGTLKATVSGALPSTTALTLANTSGATLDLTTASVAPTIASLAGGGSSGGNISFSSNTGALTVGDANNTSYSGLISGSGAIVKVGAGVLTFGNAANTYTGTTTITGGELRLNPSSTTATIASKIILNGGKLGTTSIAANTTITSSSTLKLNASSTLYLGSEVHSLKFAISSSESWTASTTLTIYGWTGTGGVTGTAGKIFFGSAAGTLTSTQLSQISFDGYSGTPILLSTGELVPAVPKPVLSTPTATVTSSTSATLGATITSNGGATITERGTAYKTSSPVAASDNQLAEGGTSVAAFSHSRTGLSPQTLYYYIGYAISGTTGISSESSFRTWSNPPTAQPTSFTASAANASITVSWNTATYPSTGATKAGYLLLYSTGSPALIASPNGTAPGSAISVGTQIAVTETTLPTVPALTASVSSLTNGTAYNFLLVPYTWDGTNATTYNYLTASALTVSATPLAPPTVTTTVAAGSITNTAASSGGQTLAGSSITAKGVVWNTSANPTIVSNLGSTNDGTGTDNFSSSITGLSAQTQYNVRAYATNVGGTGYGNNASFYTLSNEPTAAASSFAASANGSAQVDLSWTAATYPGSGASANGYIIIRRSDATDPTTTNVSDGVAPASLSLPTGTTLITTITSGATVTYSNTGLVSSQQYNYLIIPFTWDGTNAATYNYLTTSAPTANATTAAGYPSVSTNAVSSISHNSASSGGNTLTTGGSSITAKGVVWSTTTTPTLSNSSTTDGTGTADYTSSLTSLASQTLYYARAYVTNTSGTAYGNEVSFRTLSAPPTSQASGASATVNGSGSVGVSFTAASFPGSGATQAGYAVIYAAGTTPTLSSSAGAVPAAGTGTLVTITPTNLPATPSTSLTITGLTAGLTYNILIVPFTWDGSNAATYNYLTASAATASVTAVATPSVTTTAAGSITSTSASSGGSAIDAASGTISAKGVVWGTSANPTTSSNAGITSDGTGTASYSSSLTGLSAQTLYNYRAYVTNEAATTYGSNATFRTLSSPPSSQASNLTATTSSNTAVALSWTAAGFPGSGANASGYVLLRATSPNTPSLSNSNGAAPSAGANTTIVSSSIPEGTTSRNITGLTAATTYNYLLIPYTWDGTNATTYNYLTASAATASATTFAAAPITQATSLVFSAVTATTITTGWTAATGSTSGYIVLRGTANPNTDPSPGTAYTAGNTIGNASVVYVGSGTSTGAQTGLVDGTTYYYKIYTYNGSGSTINYNTTSPLSGSQATSTIGTPTATAASSVTSSGFTANWGAVTGAASYQLDVSANSCFVSLGSASTANEGFSGGTTAPTGWQITAGATYTSAGNYGAASPGLTFNASGQLVRTNQLNGAVASQLSFWLKGNSTDATSSLLVEGTTDGTNWTTIENITNSIPTTGTTKTYNSSSTPALPCGMIQFRFTYTKSTGNLAFDDVSITSAAATTSMVSGYNSLSVSGTSQAVTGLTANTTYYYRVRSVGTNSTSANSNNISQLTLNDIATADFRYVASTTGNWSTVANWEYNSTGSTWAAATQLPGSNNNINIQSTSIVTLDQNFTIATGKTVTVNGALNMGTNVIDGAGNFTLASGSTLRIGSPSGISTTAATGNLQVSGTRTLPGTANYVFNGANNQSTGNGFPATITTGVLTISNSGSTGNNTVTVTTSGLTVAALTLTSGNFAPGTGQTLNISSGGSITSTGGGIATGAAGGTIAFAGTGTVSGTITFNDVTLAGGVNFGAAATIGASGSLRINAGGFVQTNAPTYHATSTLIYANGSTYGRGSEWTTASSGAGYPGNVQAINGTTIQIGAPSSSIRMAGNLTLGTTGSAGSLTMQSAAQSLIIAGNVTIGSNTGTSTLTLSSASGGDIKVGGNWTRTANGVFAPATRAVFFTGSGTNVINSSGGASFDYIVSEKTGGSIQLATDMTVNAPNTGNALSLVTAASFDLNGYTLYLSNAAASAIQVDGGVVNFIGASGSTISMSNTGTKTISGINSGTAVFGSNVTVKTSTGLNFGGVSTINGNFQIDGGGFVQTNAPTYGSNSTLIYNSNYNRSGEWTSGSSGQGVPAHVTVNTGSTLTMNIANSIADTRTLTGNLTLNGSMSFGGNGSGTGGTVGDLTIGGNLTLNNGATLTLGAYDGSNGNDIFISGNWTRNTGGTFVSNNRAVTFQGSGNSTISTATASTFSYLFINKSGGAAVNLANDLTASQNITFTSGTITTGSNKVIIPSGSGITRNSGHVNGNLQMYVGSSTSAITWSIGDASNYTPLTLTFTGTSGTGSVTASTTGADHPQIGAASFDASKTVNRYWSLTNSGVTYTSYAGTFNFVSGDIDGGLNTNQLYAGKYDDPNWTYPAVGSRGATSVSVTGVNSMSDFQFGECATPASITSVSGASPLCIAATTTYSANGVVLGGGSGAWSSSDPSIATVNSSGVVTAVAAGTANITYTITGGCGGTVSQSAAITINASNTPSVSIASDDADNIVCDGTSVTFTATPLSTGGGTVAYQWKLNGSNVGSNNSTYNTSSLVSGDAVTCSISVTGGTCMAATTANSNTVTITVTANNTPSVSIASNDVDNTICAGTSVTFTATPSGSGGGTVAYQWKLNGNNVGTNSSTYTTGSLVNGDAVTCSISISGGTCMTTTTANSNTISTSVNNNPSAPTVSTTSATCSGDGTATIANYDGSNTYAFTPSGPTAGTGGAISGLTAGTSYTIIATNSSSCPSAASSSFSVAAQLSAPSAPGVSVTQPTCSNANGSVAISSSTSGLTFSTDGTNYAAYASAYTVAAGASYSITAKNADGCVSGATAGTMGAQPPTPSAPTVSTTSATCSGDGTATIANYDGSNTYAFTPSGPTAGTGGAISGLTAGTSYTIIATNSSSCPSAASSSFSVAAQLSAPSAPGVSVTQPTCSNANGSVAISSSTSGLTFSTDGTNYAAYASAYTVAAGAGYSITAKNADGCVSGATAGTMGAQPPTPSAPTVSATSATCSGDGTATIANYDGSNTYAFTPSGPTAGTGGAISGLTAGTSYTIIATNSSSCPSAASSSFSVAAQLSAPSAPGVSVTQPTCSNANGSVAISSSTSGLTFSTDGTNYAAYASAYTVAAGAGYSITAKNADGCVSSATAGTMGAQPPTPSTPTVSTTSATCSGDGTATIANYDGSNTYAFTPSGPTAGTGGAISGLTAGTSYTIIATNSSSCPSAASSSFSVAAQLSAPSAPGVSVTQPTCSNANGSVAISSSTSGLTFSTDGTNYAAYASAYTVAAGAGYSITAKNADGCVSSATAGTMGAQPPTPSTPTVSTTSATCSGDGTATIANYDGSNTYAFTPSGPTAGTGGAISGLTAGTSYTIIATNSSSCPSAASSSFSVAAQLSAPSAPGVSVTQPTCSNANGSVAISSSTSGLTFSTDGTNYAAYASAYTVAAGAGYSITAKNADGCVSSATAGTMGAQPPTPVAPTVSTTSATCSGDGTATITNYSGSNTYAFTPSGPTAGTGGAISGLTAGTSYTIIATNSSSCPSAASSSFSVAAQLTISTPSISTTSSTCSGAGSATITNYDASNTYAFIPSGPSVGAGGAIGAMTVGISYTVTATSSNGCVSSASVSFSIQPQLLATNSTTAVTRCSNQLPYAWNGTNYSASGTYTATLANAVGCDSVATLMLTVNSVSGSSTSVQICASAAPYLWNGNNYSTTGTYTYTTVNSVGCDSVALLQLTVNANPVAGITNNTGVTELDCSNPSISLTATGGGSYSWSGGLGSDANATISSPSTYTVTVTGADGCISTSDITITQNTTVPTAGITNHTGSTVLSCNNAIINVTATGGDTYAWSGGLGSSAAAVITSPGTYTVTVTTANGCSSNESITITQSLDVPTAGIVNNTGSSVFTCAISSISLTATGGVSYSWSNGLGNSATISAASAGTYLVTVTGANGCSSVASITLSVASSLPTFTQHPSRTTQKATLYLVPPAYTVVPAGAGTFTYQWYRNASESNSGGTLIPGATSASYVPATDTISTYYYYCVVTNQYGCSAPSEPSGFLTVCGP